MAVETVGGALLSASLKQLSHSIGLMVSTNFSSRNQVHEDLVNKLMSKLSLVSGVLDAAEGKQISDKSVRGWVFGLKDAICSVEDLVAEINYDAVQFDYLDSQSGTRTLMKVRNFLPSRYRLIKEFEKRIWKVLDWLNFFLDNKDLDQSTDNTRSFLALSDTSLVKDLYGRDPDRKAIINLLDKGGQRICVIPIVGMGGIGKTALAQLVFNDIVKTDNNNERFQIKEWFLVSDESDVLELTKRIYGTVDKINSVNNTGKPLFRLQLELQKSFKNKRILIVLDNVWNLSSESWTELSKSFDSAAYGSKILVTTRNEKIASCMRNVPNYFLQLLSEDDGWNLFSELAFNNVNPNSDPQLKRIGRQIVRKCKGLPLAIKSLACLLRDKQCPSEWNAVLNNSIWNLCPNECKVLPALWLSYHYLPPHLKRCFAYCSIFPKGFAFEKEKKKLILLWMAEDLLVPENNKTLEDIGEEYFNNLASRSLFHKDRIYGFTMHDLVNDLAKFVAGESYLNLDANSSEVTLRKVRHLSWTRYETPCNNKLKDLSKNKVLQTLLPLDRWNEVKKEFLVHRKQLKNFRNLRVLSFYRVDAIMELLGSIGKLKFLRYLDLSFTEIKEVPDGICHMQKLQTLLLHHCSNLKRLPNSIGNLKQLRYLDASKTEVEEIPESVCNLLDLHTLLLRSCSKLAHLPTNMKTLTNLCCLDVCATSLKEMPPQISELNHLETLSDFFVGKNSESSIKGLGRLQNLKKTLAIRCLENVENVVDVAEAKLEKNQYIVDLCLEWTVVSGDSRKAQEVLNGLKPHTVLKELSVKNYGGSAFPCWIGDPSFSHMVKIWLSKCKLCCSLPPLGQLPSLKSLHVDGFDAVETIGDEFCASGSSAGTKPFQSLEQLVFKFMPQWKGWSVVEGDVFSQLKELHLIECPSLTLNVDCFPKNLPSLMRLRIENCQQQLVAPLLSGEHQSLAYLYIRNNQELESFPGTSFPTTIYEVKIYDCKNLQAFSEERLLSNLRSLSISRCGKLFKHPMQWSLKTLTFLTSLEFNNIDEEVDSFPEEWHLPTSLTSLKLSNLGSLKSLNGRAFELLILLDELSIYECDGLSCLPEGLPKSLTLLDIHLCGLLTDWLQRDSGADWHKSTGISRICIDNQNICIKSG